MKNNVKSVVSLAIAFVFVLSFVFSAADAQTQARTYNIKVASPSNPEDNCVKALFYFKDLAEKKSLGRIKVDIYHSGQVGAHRDFMVEMIMGDIQAAEVNTAVLSAFDSRFMVFDIPYIAGSVDRVRAILDSGEGKKFSESLEKKTGIKIIGWMIRSPRDMYSSKNPIVTIKDFKGMKVRIMRSSVIERAFTLLGATPIPLSADERYEALQTKVVDAAENSPPLILAQKEYEVTKFVSLTEHLISPNIIGISAKFFNSLPLNLQKILLEAGDAAGRYESKLDLESEAAALEELERLGMKINEIPDKSLFIEAVKPLYQEYRDLIGADLMDVFINFNYTPKK
ncbi:MAG: TRAP transporter substrate-binding protein [Elusimicrobiota bacterium]|jgi:tripartite ATP-independent transporter DctP family solute receptor|nr:TRAP transporter substrate-binding protein [Elusimicrobiota bacterium]